MAANGPALNFSALPFEILSLVLINDLPVAWMRQGLHLVCRQFEAALRDDALWARQCLAENVCDAKDFLAKFPEPESRRNDDNSTESRILRAEARERILGPGTTWREAYERRARGRREQRIAIETIVDRRCNTFVTGSAGVGKTYVLQEAVRRLREKGLTVAVTASTGVAAVQINGTTLHSFAGAGLAQDSADEIVKKVSSNFQTVMRWRNTEVLIIEEVSMIDPDFFRKLDIIARVIRMCRERSFGGMQIVAFGDFFQLMPVSESENEYAPKFCFEIDEWEKCIREVVCLETVQRQLDAEFVAMLNRIRHGRYSDGDVRRLRSRLNASFPESITALGIEPTRLYPHRKTADDTNRGRLAAIEEQAYLFRANYVGV